MQNRKRALFNTVFLFLVFGLTLYGVFYGEDLDAMLEAIEGVDFVWLVPGICLVLFFIWCESIIIWYMMRSFQLHMKKRLCFLFSSVGFFSAVLRRRQAEGSPCRFIT